MPDGFNRRKFLATGAAVAGAAMFAGVAADAQPLDEAGGIDLGGLRKALKGQLLLPGDAGYDGAAQPWNQALPVRRPMAIAMVADQADVVACVHRAGGRGVQLVARSGGHNYAGFSTPDAGVVVDVSALDTITVHDDGTAVVGAGARLIDVYAAMDAHGRAIPAGTCSTIGIAGITMGGGIGVFARAFGLTCDHVAAARVVTADGAVVTVDTNRDADLYWALRGGGGGNAGIVTEFTFRTVPATDPITFTIKFPAEDTAAVLAAWAAWQAAAPELLTTTCSVTGGTVPTNEITGTWLGPSAGLDSQLSELVVAVGANPTKRTSEQRSYLNAVQYFAGCDNTTITGCHLNTTPGGTIPRESFQAASRMLTDAMAITDAERVVEVMVGQNEMTLLFDGLGGQVGRVGATETAFPHRAAHASVQIYSWNPDSGDAVTQVQQALTPVIGTGSYVNYTNPLQTDWASSYWGVNLPRLHRTVAAYDPDRVFDFPQSVLRA